MFRKTTRKVCLEKQQERYVWYVQKNNEKGTYGMLEKEQKRYVQSVCNRAHKIR